MRLVWMALLWGALCGRGHGSAADELLPLHECRLEHPLKIASLAARCGRLTVAENPAAPGALIELRVAVVPALNRRATASPLFLLAGGPGQSATDLYTSAAGAFARVNRNHDIVLVDQRGTGGSGRLDCPYPDDWRQTAEELPRLRAATSTCLAKFGERVRFYTSSVAVEDLDRVRTALGYARIDLYGSSYGTRVAQLYMRRHPRSVDAVVLDGVTYPEQIIGPATPVDGDRALELIVARCAKSAPCADAYPALAAELAALRRRFGADSVSLTLPDPTDGMPLQVTFNRGMLNGALRLLSYNAAAASMLPALLHRAAAGDFGLLAAQTIMLARQVGDQLASGMQNSVICAEDEPFFEGVVDRQRLARTYQGLDQIDAVHEICKIWPRGVAAADLHAPLNSDIPTLLLSGEADPVTPPEDAERAARGLTRQRHLVLAGEGHGQVATSCVPKLIADFFDHPLPEALDVTCLDAHRAAPFFTGLNGPEP